MWRVWMYGCGNGRWIYAGNRNAKGGERVCLCCCLMRTRENGNEVVGCKSSLYGAGKEGGSHPMEASKREVCESMVARRSEGVRRLFIRQAKHGVHQKNKCTCHSWMRSFIHSFILKTNIHIDRLHKNNATMGRIRRKRRGEWDITEERKRRECVCVCE